MKSFLIIGLGKFGHHLFFDLSKLGNETMAVDINEGRLEDVIQYATSAKIGDCTNISVLKALGVTNFDTCFVCVSNFQSSLEITSLLKDIGAKHVISRAVTDIHAKFLLKNGADEVVYPEKDIAEKIAHKYNCNNVFDYVELTPEFAIYEIPAKKEWIGKTIGEVEFRSKYHASIIAIKNCGKANLLPPVNYVFKDNEHLMIIGEHKYVDKLL